MSKFQILTASGTLFLLVALSLVGCQQGEDKNVTSFLPGPIISVQTPITPTAGTTVGLGPVTSTQPTPSGITRPVAAPTTASVPTPGAIPTIVAEPPIAPSPPPPPPPELVATVRPGRDKIEVTLDAVTRRASVNLVLADVTGGVPFVPPASGIPGAPNPPCNGTVNCNYLVDYQIRPIVGTIGGSVNAAVINSQVFFQAQFDTPGTFEVQFRVDDSAGNFDVFSITVIVNPAPIIVSPSPRGTQS